MHLLLRFHVPWRSPRRRRCCWRGRSGCKNDSWSRRRCSAPGVTIGDCGWSVGGRSAKAHDSCRRCGHATGCNGCGRHGRGATCQECGCLWRYSPEDGCGRGWSPATRRCGVLGQRGHLGHRLILHWSSRQADRWLLDRRRRHTSWSDRRHRHHAINCIVCVRSCLWGRHRGALGANTSHYKVWHGWRRRCRHATSWSEGCGWSWHSHCGQHGCAGRCNTTLSERKSGRKRCSRRWDRTAANSGCARRWHGQARCWRARRCHGSGSSGCRN